MNSLMLSHGHISSGYTPLCRPYSEYVEDGIDGTIYMLASEIHVNVDVVLGIKNIFELEGVINS